MEKKGNRVGEIFEPFEALMKIKGIIILDGALGTQLEVKGANIKNGLWSASLLKTHPNLIKEVHLDYLESGSDIITTAGYQASLPAFIKNGYSEEEGRYLIGKSVEIALEARKLFLNSHPELIRKPLVAASIGPYGAFLADGSEYHGNYDMRYQELLDFHIQNIELIRYSQADLLAFETIPSLEEGLAIVEALKNFPELKAWISFSCRNEEEVSHGEKLGECVKAIQTSDQIIALGINCTKPQYVEALIPPMVLNTSKWIMVYPNKGEDYDAETKHWSGDPKNFDFTENAIKWYKAGARILGGCCGTGPENIRELVNTHYLRSDSWNN